MPYTVPDRWKERLREYLRERHGEDRQSLSTYDFRSDQSVLIQFPDGSRVHFRHAFVIEDQTAQEAVIFTEHCGYHVFPLHEAEVEVLRSVSPTD